MQIKLGYRVKLKSHGGMYPSRLNMGDIGTVVDTSKSPLDGSDDYIGIEFDRYFAGHDCEGNARPGFGYYCSIYDLEILSPIIKVGDLVIETRTKHLGKVTRIDNNKIFAKWNGENLEFFVEDDDIILFKDFLDKKEKEHV